MAQLNDTMVQGDLRVTGNLYSTVSAVTAAASDSLIIADSSNGNLMAKSGISFSSGGTGFLKQDGSWGTPTDNKVTQNANSGGTALPILLKYDATTSAPTNTVNYAAGITVTPSTSTITATNFAGNATTATKINTSAKIGDTNKPVYIAADGTVTAISYTIATSVPSGAVFTDTKVTQTKDDSGTTAYPILMAGATDPNGSATTSRYDSGVKLTPSTNTISANISGNAATATNADYVNLLHTNEVNFKNVPTSGNKERVWFNYRNGDTDEPDASNLITQYYFGNRNTVTTGVTLMADNFSGNAATASAAYSGSALETAINGKLDFAEKDFGVSGSWNNQLDSAMLRILRSPPAGSQSSPEKGNVFALVGATEQHANGFVTQLAFGDDRLYYRTRHKPGTTWEWSDWQNVVTSNSITKIVKGTSIGTDADVLYVLI